MEIVRNILLVGFGGAFGSVCRYLIAKMIEGTFPWSTMIVNILGSLLIGMLVGLTGKGMLSPEMKLLLVTGFCGGFTTFSTFANESFGMLKTGDALIAALYVGVSVAVGIFAVFLGMKICN